MSGEDLQLDFRLAMRRVASTVAGKRAPNSVRNGLLLMIEAPKSPDSSRRM